MPTKRINSDRASNFYGLGWVFATSAAIKVLSLGIAKRKIAAAQTAGAERRVLRVAIGCVILSVFQDSEPVTYPKVSSLNT